MAGINKEDFLRKVRLVCSESAFVVRVAILSESRHQVKLQIFLKNRTLVTVYYNDENGKTGFAQIREGTRIFGADNANNFWHWHPYENPQEHAPSINEITFDEFLKRVEEQINNETSLDS